MIRTILVDDEIPALTKLSALLSKYKSYEICGSFSDSTEVLDHIDTLRPQVVFLDISMPGINGIDLAANLRKKVDYPLQIVFVTAYDEYAVSAFDVDASDYLLKPVSKDRFAQTIRRLDGIFAASSFAASERPADSTSELTKMIRLFGKLELSGFPDFDNNWKTAKVRELLAYFLHNRGKDIYRDNLLETLWPNMPTERALSSLNTCNYFLRRQLESSGSGITLEYDSSYYHINLNHLPCDVDLFQQSVITSAEITAENIQTYLFAASLYRGRYFENVKCTWADLDREHYSASFVDMSLQISAYYYALGNYKQSSAYAKCALDVNSLHQKAWQLMLSSINKLNDPVLLKRSLDNMRKLYLEKDNQEPPQIEILA